MENIAFVTCHCALELLDIAHLCGATSNGITRCDADFRNEDKLVHGQANMIFTLMSVFTA